jgi:putative MATE family efflux protein
MAGFSYQTVWRVAGPNIISNILMVSISFAHLWIVAPFGQEMSAAVVAGGRVHFLLMAAAMALSVATTAVVARAWGAEDPAEATAPPTCSFTLATIIAIILGGTTWLLAPSVVAMFGLDDNTARLAVDYIRPASLLNIVFALMLTVATAFRAIGDVLRPLRYTAVSTALGITASYGLVHGAVGLPAMGIEGIPWGTGIGQFMVVAWFFLHWLRGRFTLKPDTEHALEPRLVRQLVRIGAPAALGQILIQMSFLLFMMLIGGYGTAAFAAYGIGITILSITIVVGLGFGTASATLSGMQLGLGDPDAAIASGWAAMRLAIIGMTGLAVLTYAFKGTLAAMLSTDPAVRAHTEYFILILAIIQPLMAIEFAIGGAIRGAGDTRYPLLVTFAGMIVGRLSIGFLVRFMGLPVEAMYTVIVGDYAIKAGLLVLRYRKLDWRDLEKHPHAPAAIQSVAGISRGPVRTFFALGRDRKDKKS